MLTAQGQPGGQALPEGNPDEVRRAGDAFRIAGLALSGRAVLVGQLASVSGWQGSAADGYGARMQDICQRLRQAGLALDDAGRALGELANRLAEARSAWARAMIVAEGPLLTGGAALNDADLRRVNALFAHARDEADQAQRSARNQLAGTISALAALARKSRAKLPQPPPLTPVINPCGLFPQEASSAFWNNGMLPMDTVCLAWTETIIEVDGLPLVTLQPVPFFKGSGKGAGNKRPRDPNGADGPLLTPEEKLRVRAGILRALVKGNEGSKFNAQVAQDVRVRGVQVTSFETTVFNRLGRKLGDTDLETENFIVEVTTDDSEKLKQAIKLATNRKINPESKQVVVYSPKYTKDAEKVLKPFDIPLARSIDELVRLLGRG